VVYISISITYAESMPNRAVEVHADQWGVA